MDDKQLWAAVCEPSNLKRAFAKVKQNEGAPGVDQVTWQEFENNLEQNLQELSRELQRGVYRPAPVLRAYLDKGDSKPRPIGIPTVRDRTVQEALALLLTPIFDAGFLDCSFAYRPGKSALQAVTKVEALLKNGYHWVLDADIERFFDSIDHDLLLRLLSIKVPDSHILDLIRAFLRAGVFEHMNVREEYLGVAQGSALSPLLANVYLHPFDQELRREGYHLVRYADDFVILEDSQERIGSALAHSAAILQNLKLSLNEKKTRIVHAREGFVFLGYYLDIKGKGASRKAIDVISRKLAEIMKSDGRENADNKIEDLKECLRGWSNYFHTCRGIEPKDLPCLVALIEMSIQSGDEENARSLLVKRSVFPPHKADVHCRLGRLALTLGMKDEAVAEFCLALKLEPEHPRAKQWLQQIDLVDDDILHSVRRLRKIVDAIPNFSQAYRDLASCYAEMGEFGLAKQAYDQVLSLESFEPPEEGKPPEITPCPEPSPLEFGDKEISLFLSRFKGRADVFAHQWVDAKGRCGFLPVTSPLTATEVRKHLAGEETVGLYLIGPDGCASLAVIDVSPDQKILLQYGRDQESSKGFEQLVHRDVARLVSLCDDLGVPVIIEDSGCRERHLWFFFATTIPAKLARRLLKFICDKAAGPPPGIHRNVLPTQDKVRGNGFGPLVKLPLGIDKRTNRRSVLLDINGNCLPNPWVTLSQIEPVTTKQIHDILLSYAVKAQPSSAGKEETPPLVQKLLANCKVVNHLVNKAEETHCLNHSERVTLLYTLGQLGDAGRKFLHQVLSHCFDYDHDYTEKQIAKMKPNAISCARVKEKHEDIALQLGCDCKLGVPPRGYPSPILHAFSSSAIKLAKETPSPLKDIESPDQIVPEVVPEDISLTLKKYIELKRQLRGIEKSLRRVEEQMSAHLDKLEADSILTEYGMLVKKREGNKVNWVIEL